VLRQGSTWNTKTITQRTTGKDMFRILRSNNVSLPMPVIMWLSVGYAACQRAASVISVLIAFLLKQGE
jgi:hypothetical protein